MKLNVISIKNWTKIKIKTLEKLKFERLKFFCFLNLGFSEPFSSPAKIQNVMHCVVDHSTAWMTGPTNVQARRIAPTVLEVTWDRPPYDAILGYRIYYDEYPEKEMEEWENTEVCCIQRNYNNLRWKGNSCAKM